MIGLILRASHVTILAGTTGKADRLATIVCATVALLCATAFLATPAVADVIETGDAVITGFSGTKTADDVPGEGDPFDEDFIDLDGTSMQIRRLDPDAPPAGQLIDAPTVFSVKAGEVGQVFAIGLDDGDGFDPLKTTPNIYLGATSAFGIQIVRPDTDGDGRPERIKNGDRDAAWMEGQFGPDGGPGSIWKVDGKTGDVSLFATIPDNSGPGVGDIAFDKASGQFFVSNLDTGLIHRLSADGTVIDSFDHGESGLAAAGLPTVTDDGAFMNINSASFDALDSSTWGLASPERMVWGMAVYGGRLYYAVAAGPEIWSVGINLDGSFAGDSRREIDVIGTPGDYPISDIAFDSKGYMYVAQRGGIQGSYTYSDFTKPKKSVVFRFQREVPDDPETQGIWVPIPDEYAIGFPIDYRNTSGGIALGYGYDRDESGKVRRGACDLMVWSTGDALRNDSTLVAVLADGGPTIVNGLQGSDRALVRPDNEPPTITYFVDYDGQFGDRRNTGHVGDVEILQPCDKAADYGGYTPLPEVPPAEPPTDVTEFNLRIEKKAMGPCTAGGLGFLCDYVVRVTNTGSDPYVGPVVVKDQLPAAPAGAVMSFSPQPPWLCLEILPSEHQCTYDPAVLWPGDSVDLFVNVDVPAAFPLCHIDNAAGLVWPVGFSDANPADDFDIGTALIAAAHCPPAVGDTTNLTIEKFPWTPFCQEDPAAFVCRYFVIVRNTGPGVYNDTIKVAETVPAGTTATFALQPPWNCAGAGPDYTCEHEPVVLNPFEGVVLGATITVPKPLAAGLNCNVTNKASIAHAAGGSNQNTDPSDDEAEASATIPAICPALPLWNNLKLEKTGPDDRCPVVGANWECKFTLKVTNGPRPYTSEIALYDVLPFGTPAGTTIDFQTPADWNCGSLLFFPNAYGCSSANPNLAAGASVEIPMTVKVPVGPGTSCSVTNNAQIFKAPPGSLLNVFGGDDTASASAEFQTVVNGDGTMFCAWPAKAGPKRPLKQPEPVEEPTVCPQGWTPTPIPGKCCPYKTYWNGARCTRDIEPPPPPPPPPIDCWNGWFQIDANETKSYIRRGYKVATRRQEKQKIWCARKGTPPPPFDCWKGWFEIGAKQTKSYIRRGYKVRPRRKGNQKIWCAREGAPPPPFDCWKGWFEIGAKQTKSYIRRGYKVRPRRKGNQKIWCAREGASPPPLACPPPAIGKLPFCKCGPGYRGKWPRCREIEPPSCKPRDVKCQCKLKGLPYNRKTGKCGTEPPPPDPKKECLKKGWKWKKNRCVRPTSPKQECLKKGWKWKKNSCVRPTSPKQECLKKGWKWKKNSCVNPSGPKQQCLKKGWKWKKNRCVEPSRPCPKGYVGKQPNCKKVNLNNLRNPKKKKRQNFGRKRKNKNQKNLSKLMRALQKR